MLFPPFFFVPLPLPFQVFSHQTHSKGPMMRSLVLSLLLVSSAMNAQPTIHYSLGMSNPSTHYFEVGMTLSGLPTGDATLEVMMPAWRTGRYSIFDFAGGVVDVETSNGKGKSLSWKKTDKQTWRIEKGRETTVSVKYRVYANEFNSRTRGLNDEHGFVDPLSVFMYAPKYARLPLTLTVTPYGNWHVTTGLDEVKGSANTYSAPTYEYFGDCPIEIGMQKDFPFEVDGVEYVWMMAGEGNYDIERIIEDTKKIVLENKKFWGRLPYDRYIFMLHISPSSGGGTEHINSTIMGTRPFTFKNEQAYKGFLGLVSHEYFHTWNVKQLRPAGITPYDFSKENYSEELWLAEGGTSFFDELILVRTGFKTEDEYLRDIGRQIEGDRQRPGNAKQSVTESSFDAWVKFWKGTEQSYNTESDYYGKGLLATMLLNLEILKMSKGKRSFDDVMKAMFERFPVFKKGYTVEDLRDVSEEYAGGPMKSFFADHIYGTKPYPWEQAFAVAGLELVPQGGDPAASMGLSLRDGNAGVSIRGVVAGGAGETAGLSVGDEIVALNGYRVRSSDINARVSESKPGEKMSLTIFRDDRLRTVEITLGADPVPSYSVKRIKEPTETQKISYEKWLGKKWPEEKEAGSEK